MTSISTIHKTFRQNWENVVQGAYHKYPNPYNSSVKGNDIVTRYVEPETGVLYTHKLLATQWEKFSQYGDMYGSEHSVLDPKSKIFKLETFNVSLSNLVQSREIMEYLPHPENENWTLVRQTTEVKSPWRYFSNKIMGTCLTQAPKGHKAIKWVIENRLPLMPTPPVVSDIEANGSQVDHFSKYITEKGELFIRESQLAAHTISKKADDLLREGQSAAQTVVRRADDLLKEAQSVAKVFVDEHVIIM